MVTFAGTLADRKRQFFLTELGVSDVGQTLADLEYSFFGSDLGSVYVGQSGAETIIGPKTFEPAAASGVALIVKGLGSQTGDLQQWQDSTGTKKAFINSVGDVAAQAGYFTGGIPGYMGARLHSQSIVAEEIALITKGQVGQTADLQQWQNSAGSVLVAITPSGGLRFAGDSLAEWVRSSASTLRTDANLHALSNVFLGDGNLPGTGGIGRVNIGTALTTLIGLVVRGRASQTADLQQWQDSTAAVKAKVTADGDVQASRLMSINALFQAADGNGGGITTFAKSTSQQSSPGTDFVRLYFRDGTTGGTLKLVVRAGSAGAETTVLDNIPQS